MFHLVFASPPLTTCVFNMLLFGSASSVAVTTEYWGEKILFNFCLHKFGYCKVETFVTANVTCFIPELFRGKCQKSTHDEPSLSLR